MQPSLQTEVNSWRRIIGLACAGLALALLLGGCSMLRAAYNQVSTLAYWRLDSYVDFNDEQAPRVRQALDATLAWHRRTQLPDYALLLARAQREVLNNTTPAAACAWKDEVLTRLDPLLERMLPAIAEIMVSITPEQLQHIERRMAKSSREFRSEYLQADAAERASEGLKRTVERAEMLYGRLEPAQRDRIAQALAASPFDAERWLVERQHRQRELLQTLSAVSTAARSGSVDRATVVVQAQAQAQAAVRVMAERMERSPRADYRAYQERVAQTNCAIAASIHNHATPAQRQTARAKLKAWEDDARALAVQTNGGNGGNGAAASR